MTDEALVTGADALGSGDVVWGCVELMGGDVIGVALCGDGVATNVAGGAAQVNCA